MQRVPGAMLGTGHNVKANGCGFCKQEVKSLGLGFSNLGVYPLRITWGANSGPHFQIGISIFLSHLTPRSHFAK